jgi:Fe-Mn family superoxide dismutase
MTTATVQACTPKTFAHLQNGADGISADMMQEHFKLYNGYVTNVNTLVDKLKAMPVTSPPTPEWAEYKRRLGWEMNGVILHEMYFENMKPSGGLLDASTKLYKAITNSFGSYANWEADFKATGLMRGIGWVITYACAATGELFNQWVSEHEIGHPVGAKPVLVMDVWEHAYIQDYKATGRKPYIDAFFKNIDWDVAEKRLG